MCLLKIWYKFESLLNFDFRETICFHKHTQKFFKKTFKFEGGKKLEKGSIPYKENNHIAILSIICQTVWTNSKVKHPNTAMKKYIFFECLNFFFCNNALSDAINYCNALHCKWNCSCTEGKNLHKCDYIFVAKWTEIENFMQILIFRY